MHPGRNQPNQKLTTNKKNILRIMLAAYLLVAMGLFSWIPSLLFQHGDPHKATIQDVGYMVTWTMHHDDEHLLDHELNNGQVVNQLLAVHDIPDHVLDTPSDDFIKYMLKVAIQADTLTVFAGFLLLWAFIALLKLFVPRDTGTIPVFKFPIRNSIPILIRSTVLRH